MRRGSSDQRGDAIVCGLGEVFLFRQKPPAHSGGRERMTWLVRDRIASEFRSTERAHRLDIVQRLMRRDHCFQTTALPPPSGLETRRASCASAR